MANLNIAEIRNLKPNRIEYECVKIYHPSFGNVNLVNNQVFSKTFEGVTYEPAVFSIKESRQSSSTVVQANFSFPRLDNDFKDKLDILSGTTSKILSELEITRLLYDEIDTSTPLSVWKLYGDTINITLEGVTVQLSTVNPINQRCVKVYAMEEWTGLILS